MMQNYLEHWMMTRNFKKLVSIKPKCILKTLEERDKEVENLIEDNVELDKETLDTNEDMDKIVKTLTEIA